MNNTDMNSGLNLPNIDFSAGGINYDTGDIHSVLDLGINNSTLH